MNIDNDDLKNALKKTSEIRYGGYDQNLSEHKFSDEFESHMDELIAIQNRKKLRFFTKFSKRAVCIIVAVIVLCVSSVTIYAVMNSHDILLKVNESYVIISADEKDKFDYPLSLENKYVLTNIPEGYKLNTYGVENNAQDFGSIQSFIPSTSEEKDRVDYDYYLKSNNSEIIFTQQTKARFYDFYPKADVKTEYIKDDSGQEYLFCSSENSNKIFWDNGDYILSIKSDLSKNHILDLCKSTKLYEK